MDTSSSMSWLSELEMEDPFWFQGFQMDTLGDPFGAAADALAEDFQQYYSFSSSEGESSPPTFINPTHYLLEAAALAEERPKKQHKPNNAAAVPSPNSTTSPEQPSFPCILAFAGSNFTADVPQPHCDRPAPAAPAVSIGSSSSGTSNRGDNVAAATAARGRAGGQGRNSKRSAAAAAAAGGAAKTTSHSRHHIMAERLRREKLTQQFIALSAIVPGLKKVDKTSVLAEAIKYMKQLQEQVRAMEEKSAKKSVESNAAVKSSQISLEDDDGDNSSSIDNDATDSTAGSSTSSDQLPEIEARISGRSVLLRVHCEKQKGVMVKTLGKMENLNFTVVSTCLSPVGDTTVDVTIIAQMENDPSAGTPDIVKALRSAFRDFA